MAKQSDVLWGELQFNNAIQTYSDYSGDEPDNSKTLARFHNEPLTLISKQQFSADVKNVKLYRQARYHQPHQRAPPFFNMSF